MKHTFCQRNLRGLFLLPAVLGLLSLEAQAAIIVEVQNANIAVNSVGTVDVLVYSDSGDLPVGGFGFAFQISPTPGTVGRLAFLDMQIANETSSASQPYLFDGANVVSDSFVTTETYLDGFVFYDFLSPLFDPLVDFSTLSSDKQLLIRLDVKHVLLPGTDATLALSDEFEITPILENGGFPTFDFLDNFGDPLLPGELASSSGTVRTFLGPTAVPEPGHMVLMLAGVAGAWLRKRRAGLSSKMH